MAGKVIAIDGAPNILTEKEGFILNPYASDEKQAAGKIKKEKELKERFLDSEVKKEDYWPIPFLGAIIENNLDITHPLSLD